ncbi:hypothetical protein PHISP_04762 [Aspergillus sp. HF37]|nr:hypothetical protein PHISP_04762 [Aspergillus sp. HF37]
MGVCASCLGLARRDPNDSAETSRLLDDDIYHARYGYSYGALNHANQLHEHQPDPEHLKREREALDAICQRTSDSVVDIWSIQPQPPLQPRATLQPPGDDRDRDRAQPAPVPVTTTAPAPSDRPTSAATQQPVQRGGTGTVPRHWGEVVINPRRTGKAARPGLNLDEAKNGGNVFGVLNVA